MQLGAARSRYLLADKLADGKGVENGRELLIAREVLNALEGDTSEGGGLMLRIRGVSASWVLRYTASAGRRREMGLGQASQEPPASWRKEAEVIHLGCHACAGSAEPGWVCAEHPGKPWQYDGCEAEGAPCDCNPAGRVGFVEVLAS